MIQIRFPTSKPSLRTSGGQTQVLCLSRKKWILLTPEEWVRQNILLYMTETLGYPLPLIAVEKQLQVGELSRRFDIVVYRDDLPFLVMECKEMETPIVQSTLDQVLRYNIPLRAPYFFISNGITCYGFERHAGSFTMLDAFPEYNK